LEKEEAAQELKIDGSTWQCIFEGGILIQLAVQRDDKVMQSMERISDLDSMDIVAYLGSQLKAQHNFQIQNSNKSIRMAD
jgi:hypothetical protein